MAGSSYSDFLSSRGYQAPGMSPAAAQAAQDPNKLLAAIQIAKQLHAQQSAPPQQIGPAPQYGNNANPNPNVQISSLVAQAANNSYVIGPAGNQPNAEPSPQPTQTTNLNDAVASAIASAAGTGSQAVSTAANIVSPVTSPIINTAINAAKGVGVAADQTDLTSAPSAIGNYASDRYQKWLDATNQSKAPSYLAPVEAGINTLAPDIASGVLDVGKKVKSSVVDPATAYVSTGATNIKSGTWDAMSPEQQGVMTKSLGLDQAPSTAEIATGAGKLLEAMTLPQQKLGRPLFGEIFYQMAISGAVPFDADTKAQIIAAYQKGGATGVWQDWIAKGAGSSKDRSALGLVYYALYHAGIDVLSDPLTWTPLAGEWLKGMAEARAASDAIQGSEGVSKVATGLNIAGHLVNAPNEIADAAMNAATNVTKGVGNLFGKIPGVTKAAGFVAGTGSHEADQAARDIMDALAAKEMKTGIDSGALPVDPAATMGTARPANMGTVVGTSANGKYVIYQDAPKADGIQTYTLRDNKGEMRRGGFKSLDEVANSPLLEGKGIKVSAAPGVGPESGNLPATPVEPKPSPDVVPSSGADVVPPTEPVPSPNVAPIAGDLPVAPTEPVPSLNVAPESGALPTTGFEININDAPAPGPQDVSPQAYQDRVDQWIKDQEALGGHLPDWTVPDASLAAPVTDIAPTEPPTWGIDSQIRKAKDAAVSREAALANGGDLPLNQFVDTSLHLPENAKSIETKMQNILFNPDYNATAADRQYLYAKGDLLKPSQVTDAQQAIFERQVMNASVKDVARDANGYPIHDPFAVGGLHVNDAALEKLPEEVKNALLAGGNQNAVFSVDGQFQFRVIDNAMLDAMSKDVRQQVLDAVNGERLKAVQRWQDIQDVHPRLHGTSPVAATDVRPNVVNPSSRSSGILPKGSDKVQALADKLKPRRPVPLNDVVVHDTFSAPLQAQVNIGKLTNEEAATLDQLIPVKGARPNAKGILRQEPIYERYDRYIMQGMSERDAMLQTTMDAVSALHMAKGERYKLQALLKVYDRANLIAKQNIQYNVLNAARGPIGDWAGDGWTMIVTGHGAAIKMGWGDLQAIAKDVLNLDPTAINEARSLSFLHETGVQLPSNITIQHNWKGLFKKGELESKGKGLFGADKGFADLSLVKTTKELAGTKAGNIAQVPAFVLQNKWAKIGREVFDTQRRISVFTHEFTRIVKEEGANRFEMSLIEAARKAGVDPQVWRDAIKTEALNRMTTRGEGELVSGMFSSADVFNATGSTDLSRKWQSFLKDAVKQANAEQNRVLFSYAGTNADKMLSRVMFFHYWMTRALALHTETALRNPQLLALYVRTYNGLDQLAQDNGYPSGMRGLVDYFQSATGFTHYFNPVGIVVPYMQMSQVANGSIPWWQRAGIFLSPFAEGGLAMMGMTSSIPDVTGTGTIRNAALAFANYLKADGYELPGAFGPDGQLTEDYVANLEASIYQAGNHAFQSMGLTAKDYAPFDPQTAEVAQIKAVITSNMVAQYGPQESWSDAVKKEYVDAQTAASAGGMTSNEQAHKAFKTVTMEQLFNKGLNAVIPGGSQLRYNPLDQARALNKTIAFGSDPSTLTPEQVAAQNMMAGVNASGQGGKDANHTATTDIGLTSQEDAYRALGTPRQQALAAGYNAILYGTGVDLTTGDASIRIGGKDYLISDIQAMPAASQQLLADQFLTENGGTAEFKDLQAQQKAYKDAHPQIVDFKAYQKAVYGDAGGPRGWREKYAKSNPNFSAAMESQKKLLQSDGSADFIVQRGLDQWASGRGGYEAAYGIPSNIYDVNQKPLSSNDTTAAAVAPPTAAATAGSTGGATKAAKTTTEQTLTQDITDYQTKAKMLQDAMAAKGMTGSLADYTASPYQMKYIQNVFGDLLPTESSLMKKYDAWVQGQPAGADTSPTAFGQFYDKTAQAATVSQPKITGWSAKKTALYYAWKAQQGVGVDTTPSGFDRYLVTLSGKAIAPYAPTP